MYELSSSGPFLTENLPPPISPPYLSAAKIPDQSRKDKQRFTFGTVVGTDNLRCHPTFKGQFEDYLRTVKRVDPAEYEVITIASCTGHSFVYTKEIPDGESEDIEYLTPRSYARLGSICHGTHIGNAQSILRQGLDVDYGVKTGHK